MNDAEINGMAQGIMMYLMQETKSPVDTLAVILCLVLLYYEKAKRPDAVFPIEEFAEQIRKDIVHHWGSRMVVTEGTDTVQ